MGLITFIPKPFFLFHLLVCACVSACMCACTLMCMERGERMTCKELFLSFHQVLGMEFKSLALEAGSFRFDLFYFTCIRVLPACMSVYLVVAFRSWRPEGALGLLELEFQKPKLGPLSSGRRAACELLLAAEPCPSTRKVLTSSWNFSFLSLLALVQCCTKLEMVIGDFMFCSEWSYRASKLGQKDHGTAWGT